MVTVSSSVSGVLVLHIILLLLLFCAIVAANLQQLLF